MTIMHRKDNVHNDFTRGSIDNLMIYNRTLSPSEIMSIYKNNAKNPTQLSPKKLPEANSNNIENNYFQQTVFYESASLQINE